MPDRQINERSFREYVLEGSILQRGLINNQKLIEVCTVICASLNSKYAFYNIVSHKRYSVSFNITCFGSEQSGCDNSGICQFCHLLLRVHRLMV